MSTLLGDGEAVVETRREALDDTGNALVRYPRPRLRKPLRHEKKIALKRCLTSPEAANENDD